MSMFACLSIKRKPQQGISLVIVMIFLVILSVLGVSAIQTSTLSSRIARNEADRNLAFQAAEAALRDAELDARNLKYDLSVCVKGVGGCRTQPNDRGSYFTNACTDGRCASVTGATPVWETASRWSSSGSSVAYGTYTGAAQIKLVSQQPRYLLEAFQVDGKSLYRITSVGFGVSPSSQVMMQNVIIVTRQK